MSNLSKKGIRARSALLRMGFTEDEIDQQFDTEEKLIAFYKAAKEVAKSGTSVPDETEEKEAEDSFKLPPDEAKRLLAEEEAAQKQEKQVEYDKNAVIDPDTGSAMVSFDDFMKSIEGIDLDDPDIPNN